MPNVLAKDIIDTIDKNFRHFIEENKSKKFVIYTNGMGGTLVRNYLKSKFSIIPEYIIDNKFVVTIGSNTDSEDIIPEKLNMS